MTESSTNEPKKLKRSKPKQVDASPPPPSIQPEETESNLVADPEPPLPPVPLGAPQQIPIFIKKSKGFKLLINQIDSYLIAQGLPSIVLGDGSYDLRTYHLEFGSIPGVSAVKRVSVVSRPGTPDEKHLDQSFRLVP